MGSDAGMSEYWNNRMGKNCANWFSLMILLLTMAACAQTKYTANVQSTYTNPVLDRDFPDPSVINATDGWYYAYGTNSSWHGNMVNIQVARSLDLVHWQYLGDALPDKPEWANSTQQFWAPDITYDPESKTYYLYFASGHNGTKNHCIGVATSKLPQAPFLDTGHPLACGKDFTYIDPMEFDDPRSGKHYMFWGSDFAPLMGQELANDRVSFSPNSKPHVVLEPSKKPGYNHLVEASWVIYRKGYYYLFYSGNNCCGKDAHYAVMVARSRHVLGPYKRFKGVNGSGNGVILEKNSHWDAPGHNAIIRDEKGQYWILYHAVSTSKRNLGRVLMLDRIKFEKGWPRVEGDGPSYTAQPAPVIKK
ncbi:MAG TPA: glycoside hydrolase family 43 protein [Balneolales bacterium]|nr:glycoside hydrolase family 43 protein [Balneolales bacterium]